MKVIDSIWFSSRAGYCGLVLGEDEFTGERTLYAGVARGLDQKADEREILGWGNRVNLRILEGLIAETHSAAIEEAKRIVRRVEKEKGRKR